MLRNCNKDKNLRDSFLSPSRSGGNGEKRKGLSYAKDYLRRDINFGGNKDSTEGRKEESASRLFCRDGLRPVGLDSGLCRAACSFSGDAGALCRKPLGLRRNGSEPRVGARMALPLRGLPDCDPAAHFRKTAAFPRPTIADCARLYRRVGFRTSRTAPSRRNALARASNSLLTKQEPALFQPAPAGQEIYFYAPYHSTAQR